MDPLTAFGLASNVISFVSFASALIQTSFELHRSDSDATGYVLSLDKVYGDLETLNSRLEFTCQPPTADEDACPWVSTSDEYEVEKIFLAAKGLADLCKEDSDMRGRTAVQFQPSGMP